MRLRRGEQHEGREERCGGGEMDVRPRKEKGTGGIEGEEYKGKEMGHEGNGKGREERGNDGGGTRGMMLH